MNIQRLEKGFLLGICLQQKGAWNVLGANKKKKKKKKEIDKNKANLDLLTLTFKGQICKTSTLTCKI